MITASKFLTFECNYGCGAQIDVRTDDYTHLKCDGIYSKSAVHEWLGRRIWEALADHLVVCKEANPQLVGTPWLTVVK